VASRTVVVNGILTWCAGAVRWCAGAVHQATGEKTQGYTAGGALSSLRYEHWSKAIPWKCHAHAS
jgi:hypothetical protein